MNIIKIAKKEIIFNFRNYWVFLSALIFCIVNFVIIYFGETISGDYSQTDIRSLALSIIHLQMYLIPLLSFILSYDSILFEKELGIFDLILSYRITLLDIFIGKLFGNSLIFFLSFVLGFFPVAVYLFLLGIKLYILAKFIIAAMWLSFVFNAFAIYISYLSKDRTFVILLSIFIWLFFIFIYDILFTFLAIISFGTLSSNMLSLLLFFNPAEIFRLISIIYFIPYDANDLFVVNSGFLNLFYIIISMCVWFLFSISIFVFTYLNKR